MTVIADFVGLFEVVKRTHPNTSGDDKSDYYPSPGTQIQLKQSKVQTQGDQNPVEVDCIRGTVVSGVWSGKDGFEKAVFFFRGERLVSNPIATDVPDIGNNNGQRFVELSEFLNGGKDEMKHYLAWSDGDLGCWGCKRVS